MAQRRLDNKRPTITVSLDPDDYAWIESFKGSSLSYTASRLIHAAKLAGLGLDEAIDSAGNLKEFRDFLKARRGKSKVAAEMLELLSAYLDQ